MQSIPHVANVEVWRSASITPKPNQPARKSRVRRTSHRGLRTYGAFKLSEFTHRKGSDWNKEANSLHHTDYQQTMSAQIYSSVELIERAILKATHGNIGMLNIQKCAGEIVLRGRCASSSCKKLAQDAAIPLIGESRLVNAIQIG